MAHLRDNRGTLEIQCQRCGHYSPALPPDAHTDADCKLLRRTDPRPIVKPGSRPLRLPAPPPPAPPPPAPPVQCELFDAVPPSIHRDEPRGRRRGR